MKKIIDRPRSEYLMVQENAPVKRCKVHIWKRRSRPKVCRICGVMKPQEATSKPDSYGVTGFDIDAV